MHQDNVTTEDIAAVEEPRPDEEPRAVDETEEPTGAGESREPEESREAEEPGLVASDRVSVDETARPADTTLAGQTRPHEHEGSAAADVLFDEADAARFRERWHEVQAAFVDDPKRAVQDADVLVAELMQNLASAFSERKRLLEDQWREGTDAETEDLRLALRGYRSFLDQLLAH
jgi:hypothetical protein